MSSDSRARTRAGLGLFAAGFVLVLAILHPVLDQPPVWDTTMGLFPSAIVLAENGFDLADLLARPSWSEGGPNIHPFSLPTWLTAAALRVFSNDVWLLRFLHLVHFAIAALALLGTLRLAAHVLAPGLAMALTGALLLFPLFQVQAGYLYSEMPLAACSIWAVLSGVQRRWRAAVAWSALACFVKEPGIVVPVALVAAAAIERAPLRARARRVAALAVAPGVVGLLQITLALPTEAAAGYRAPYSLYATDVLRKLAAVPDLALLLASFVVVCVLGAGAAWRALRAGASDSDGGGERRERALALGLLLFGSFVGFYALVPLTGTEVYLLPRYYVQIVPFALLGATAFAARTAGRRPAALLLALLAVFFIVNRDGRFYPPVSGNEFSLAERSFEYRDLLTVQSRLVREAAALRPDTPVFYGLPEHFLFEYPRMGYAEAPLARGHCVWLEERYRRGRLADYPDRFAILYNFAGYGGNVLQSLLRQARADPARRVRPRVFAQGRYRTVLFRVTTGGGGPRGSRGARKVQP